MNKVADKMAEKHGDDIKGDAEEKMRDLRDKLGDSELSAEDWNEIEDRLKRDAKKKAGKMSALEKILGDSKDRRAFKNICGATTYKPDSSDSETMLDDDLIEALKGMEDTDYHETTLGKSEVIDKKATKITWRTAVSDDYTKEVYACDSRSMKAHTNKLKKKIQLYGNKDRFTIRNQKRGRLDKRMLHRIPMDRRDIFSTTIVKEDKPLDVCLLVDESGSMGSLMMYARKSCVAVKEALEDNHMLDLWVMGHTADGHDGWHQDPRSTNMTIYHSPSIKDRKHALGSMKARYENRDGNAILASAQRVKEESSSPMSNKLMIVFSDGSPAAIGYGGQGGIDHVAKVVKGLEAKGWSIIQVGFGGAHLQERMFSNHIYVDNIADLSGKISKIIRRVIKV
jgi:nitric oxide reductase activation protein